MSNGQDPEVFSKRGRPEKNADHDSKPSVNSQNNDNSVLLSTGPVRASFFYKYLISTTPIFLIIVSFFLRMLLNNLFAAASSFSFITSAMNIIILLIAPVGIFVLFAVIGFVKRITELWTGTILTLILSFIGGIILANFISSPAASGGYFELVLQWTSFLVQPFCLAASLVLIYATERFRRSLRYTLKNDGLWIRGGFWTVKEHMIPYSRIERIIFEQGLAGKKYNFGTIIPLTRPGADSETSFFSSGASGEPTHGRKDDSGKRHGKISRDPLECLCGIPEPEKAQKILIKLMHESTMQPEEQISRMKKIFETSVAEIMADKSVINPGVSPVTTKIPPSKKDDLQEEFFTHEIIPKKKPTQIFRVTDDSIPESAIVASDNFTREIPPLKNAIPEKIAASENPPGESVFDQIKKLAELRDSGIITEDEFTNKKTELLKRI